MKLEWLILLIVYVYATDQTTEEPSCAEETTSSGVPLWISLPLVVILIMFSGLFSGLTLGLLGLDLKQLEIVASGNSDDKVYAEMIIPVRLHGNFLLCTLLLGNVMVNAALSILLADLTSGVVGFVVSTVLIVIFGEIIPQASCSRYALYIGAKTVYIVRVLMVILAPAAWPISKVLDWALGPEFGNMYSNLELKKLIELHKLDDQVELDVATAKVLEGALLFHDQTVGSVMTPWDQCYKLNMSDRLNFEMLLNIFKKGHSRIPVVHKVRGQETLAGMVLAKDLILLDPEDEIPVSTLVQLFEHKLVTTFSDASLADMLREFQTGLSHLAIVRDVDNSGMGDPVYVLKGIVTLEDIIEVILQENIIDETDVFVSTRSKAKINRKFDFNKLALFDYRKGMKGTMLHTEAAAVYHHIIKSVPLFFPRNRKVSEAGLKNLLRSTAIIEVEVDGRDRNEDIDNGGLRLYQMGQQTEFFTLLLEGKVDVYAGKQKFRSEHARWSMFCPDVLESVQNAFVDGIPQLDVVSDFTCIITKDSRILRISRQVFLGCLQGKYDKLLPEESEDAAMESDHGDVGIEIRECRDTEDSITE